MIVLGFGGIVMDSSDGFIRLFSPGLSTVVAVFTASITVIIVSSVLRQILFKNPSKPPVVFHWIPFIGSTVTYGIDPYKFYFDCQAKVDASFTTIARS